MAESMSGGEAAIRELMTQAEAEAGQPRETEVFPPGTIGPLTPGQPGRAEGT
jgi:hypothetical protein